MEALLKQRSNYNFKELTLCCLGSFMFRQLGYANKEKGQEISEH